MNIGQADWPLGKGQFLHWAVVNRHRTAKAPIKQRERSCPRFQGLWILCCIFQFSSLGISFSHFLSLHALELFDFPCTQCKVCTTEHCQTFSGHASFKPWSVLKMGGKLQKKLCLFLGFHWTLHDLIDLSPGSPSQRQAIKCLQEIAHHGAEWEQTAKGRCSLGTTSEENVQ